MCALGVVLASCLACTRQQAREIQLKRVQDKREARGDHRKGQSIRQRTHSSDEDRHRDTPLAVLNEGQTICLSCLSHFYETKALSRPINTNESALSSNAAGLPHRRPVGEQDKKTGDGRVRGRNL
jgi:hypothetical protein